MDSERMARILAPFLRGTSLPESALLQLVSYLDLLLRWNARVNLTALRDPEYVVSRHFGESLFLGTRLFPAGDASHDATGDATWRNMLDFGSGAGFPGLPIKIAVPALELTLLESRAKKAAFLREVVRSLSLEGAEVVEDRAERLQGRIAGSANGGWAVVALRAVERFEVSATLAATMVAPRGTLALLIGRDQAEQVTGLLPGFSWYDPEQIPGSDRRVIMLGTKLKGRESAQ